MVRSRNIIAVPPGETIKEQLIDRGMSQKDFAARMGMSTKHICHLINGDVRLTPEVAFRLEMVFGIPASFWNNLESVYREKIVRAEAENEMEQDIEIVKKYPYKEMAKNGWVEEATKPSDKVVNLRKFFEVANLGLIEKESLAPGIACRRMADGGKADYALYAWAQKAKLESRNICTRSIDLKKLQADIPEIRGMTLRSPEIFCEKLRETMMECGVALVFLPHISSSFLHGATFYDKNKIVMGLTVRGKDADRFWFSLFHEVAHILLGHIGQQGGTTQEDENAADCFARDTLIAPSAFNAFVEAGKFTKTDIIRFASVIGVAPGIVVGRLQKEGYIKYSWCNDLKAKYEIVT